KAEAAGYGTSDVYEVGGDWGFNYYDKNGKGASAFNKTDFQKQASMSNEKSTTGTGNSGEGSGGGGSAGGSGGSYDGKQKKPSASGGNTGQQQNEGGHWSDGIANA